MLCIGCSCIEWWIGRYREGYGVDYYQKLLKRANTPNSKVNPAFKQVSSLMHKVEM